MIMNNEISDRNKTYVQISPEIPIFAVPNHLNFKPVTKYKIKVNTISVAIENVLTVRSGLHLAYTHRRKVE